MSSITVDECTFDGGRVFFAYDADFSFPINGGLRVMQYESFEQARKEASGLATAMIAKHNTYHTGFSGGKIVAAVEEINEQTIDALIDVVSHYLNSMNGMFYTGCDINFGEKEVQKLAAKTDFILAALDSPIHYADATAHGVLGGINAAIHDMKLSEPTLLVHGCGAVGSRVARKMDASAELMTFDIEYTRANIDACMNISGAVYWYTFPHDILVLVSASGIITLEMLQNLKARAIVCGANIPFASQEALDYARSNFLLIEESVASAGAVIADSIEHYATDKWATSDPRYVYHFIESLTFDAARSVKLIETNQPIGKHYDPLSAKV
jgi:leucine dehydrogenase